MSPDFSFSSLPNPTDNIQSKFLFLLANAKRVCFAAVRYCVFSVQCQSKKENSYSRASLTLSMCVRVYFICPFSSSLALLFCCCFCCCWCLLLLLFFHFVGSYADSVEIERRSQSRRWAHSTKSQSPIFAEHFSSESLTQLFFSHRSFASAAKCNRTLACHIVWMWIYIYIRAIGTRVQIYSLSIPILYGKK